jgi:membrane-associated phospholipid phosphatase
MPTLLLLAVLAQEPAAAQVQEPASPQVQEPAPAPAQTAEPAHLQANELSFSWAADLSVTGGLGLAWILSETAFKKDLAPAQCRWCATNALDNAIRRAFVPAGTVTLDGVKGPDIASGVTGFVLTPLFVLGLDALMAQSFKGWVQDGVMVLEAVMAALVVNQIVKFSVGRQRPFVSDLTPAQQAMTAQPSDNNLSFYSGHATFTAAFAVAGGVVATLRGYKYPWLIWLLGGAASVTTSVLRIAADKHYFTDVLTGTLLSGAIAAAVPLLFHRIKQLPVQASVTPAGVALRADF